MLQTGYIHKYIRYNHSVIHKNMPPLFYDNFGKRPILKKDFHWQIQQSTEKL